MVFVLVLFYSMFRYTIEEVIVSIAINNNIIVVDSFCIFIGIFVRIFPTSFVMAGCIMFINISAPIPQTMLKLRVTLPFRFSNSPV